MKTLPSAERLRALLDYDPATGILTWKRQAGTSRSVRAFNNKCAGKVAGTPSGRKPYLLVGLDRRYYLAHRIIWKMVTGEEPPQCIDHKDGDCQNNRWGNFRRATNGQNVANSAPRSRSGFKGVYKHHKKWRAVVRFDNVQRTIGHYDTPEIAAQARHAAALKYQGEFARTY